MGLQARVVGRTGAGGAWRETVGKGGRSPREWGFKRGSWVGPAPAALGGRQWGKGEGVQGNGASSAGRGSDRRRRRLAGDSGERGKESKGMGLQARVVGRTGAGGAWRETVGKEGRSPR